MEINSGTCCSVKECDGELFAGTLCASDGAKHSNAIRLIKGGGMGEHLDV